MLKVLVFSQVSIILCIGMRRQNWELFNSKISPFVEAVNMIVGDDDTRMVELPQHLT